MFLFIVIFVITQVLVSCTRMETWENLAERAHQLSEAGHYDSATELAESALAKVEAKFGRSDPAVAVVLNLLGNVYRYKAEYAEAESLLTRALEIRENIFGPEDTLTAESQNSLGVLYYKWSRFDTAEFLLTRALDTRETVFGSMHVLVAESQKDLGMVVRKEGGRYAEAESLLIRSREIREKLLGPSHPDVAENLTELGILCWNKVQYDEAEQLHERAVQICERSLGSEHPDLATSLNALAITYSRQGGYLKAEQLYRRALNIRERVLGRNHPDVAQSLHNLADLYINEGKYNDAELLLKRALEIGLKVLGPNHRDVAFSYYTLGNLYMFLGRYDEAQTYVIQAMHIWENVLGHEHENVAACLQDLGRLSHKKGRRAEAESLLSEARRTWERTFVPNHPGVANCLSDLGFLYNDMGNWEHGLSLGRRAHQIHRNNFREGFVVWPEIKALRYSRFMRIGAANYLSMLSDSPDMISNRTQEMVNVVLSCKGPVSDGIFARRRTYGSQQDSSLKPLADSLFKTRWTWDVNAGRVARALPADAVLIEYLKYNHTKIGLETDPRYLAVVVNNKGDIAAFDLGSAGAIDSSVLWYRSYFEYPELTDARDYPRISKGIYDLVIKPFAKKLDHESMVFVAPDGSLNLISFAGLLDEDGQYLIEKYAVHYLSAGRDLLRLEEQPPAGEGLLVMGDPDFDVPAAERMSAAMMAHAPPESSGLTEKSVPTIWSGTQAVTRRKVPRLPSARREVQSVREQWERDNLGPVIAYLGAEASEENFKEQAPGKRVIHLATHGDFVCPGEADRLLAGGPALWEPLYAGEDPLLQSSLLLAGANLCEAGLDTLKAEDGRLTAAEVAAMDLSGTELVVLSGCETGLGEVKSGEGMWGLRRAFQMAGARTVISTLWVIQDNESTVDFVARLYAAKRKDLALLMRDIAMECIQELREGGHPDYPLTWGAFIALGDWRIQ